MNSNKTSDPLYIQLTDTYAPAWGHGGPVRLMYDYARWLSDHFRVTAHTSDIHHDFTRIAARRETSGNVTICRHKLFFPKLATKSIYVHSPSMWLEAAKEIYRSHSTAIVHFSVFRGLVPLYAMMLKLLFRKRMILVHSAFGSLHYKRAAHRAIYDAIFLKPFVKLVDLRLVQNEHEREVYCRIGFENGAADKFKLAMLPLHLNRVPFDESRFTKTGKNQAEVDRVRRELGVPEHAIVILFLGRLNPAKGILRMIDAFLQFCRSHRRETLLLIVGHDDGFQVETERYIATKGVQQKVRIINNVYESRFDYYYLADLFVGFPTIFEETMLASLEALACSTPVVVSKEADVPFIEEEQAGYVIEFDPSTAATVMSNIIENLSVFQTNARRAAAHFDQAELGSKLLALLREASSAGLTPISEAELAQPV